MLHPIFFSTSRPSEIPSEIPCPDKMPKSPAVAQGRQSMTLEKNDRQGKMTGCSEFIDL